MYALPVSRAGARRACNGAIDGGNCTGVDRRDRGPACGHEWAESVHWPKADVVSMRRVELRAAMELVTKPVLKATPFLPAYHRHLAKFQGQPLTMLEVGVYGGGSLQMWRHFLGPQATIVGVDVLDGCKQHEADGIHVRIGDQGDPDFLVALDDEFGPFTIVVDDGGHHMHQQLTTFETLFPRLAAGGVYACEDTSTSYSSEFGGGRGNPGTFIEAMKAKVDELHAWYDPDGERTDFTLAAASVCFYAGIVVIDKGAVEPRVIGSRGDGTIVMIPEEPAPEP
jgi:cephalosporin hydroxylase